MSQAIDISLHYKQTVAYESEATEILYGGAKGGGKSFLFRAAAILWASQIPGLQVYLFRRTSPDLWKNHMQGPGSFPALLGPWLQSKIVSFNSQKMYFQFWNGAQISLCHCQYEKDLINYQGAEIHVLMIDELTQWLKAMYQYLRGQVRLGGLKIPRHLKGKFPRILCGANPGGIGHNWVKAGFIDMARPLDVMQMDKPSGGLKRQFIPALLEDNPTLTENDPEYENRLEGMGSAAMVKAMRWGIWDIVAGGAFDDVWEPDKHIIPAFEIPMSWRIDRSFDWGSSHPFSVGWWAESDGTEATLPDGTKRNFPPGTIFRIAEFYGWNGNPDEGCKLLAVEIARKIKEIEKTATLLKGRRVIPGPADSQIYDVQNGVCLADDMARGGVTWLRADKSPCSRQTGLEVLRRLLKSSLSFPMEDPGLLIFDTCRHFIRTVPVLPRDERKPDEVDTNAEDHCLSGETLVDTDSGPIPIIDLVGKSGKVFTIGGGLVDFWGVRKTQENQEIIKITFSNGTFIKCTPEHKFLTISGQWVEGKSLLNEYSYNIIGHIIKKSGMICKSKLLARPSKNLMARDITFVDSIFKSGAGDYTGKSGNTTMDQFQRALKCIIKTTTEAITKMKIWNCGLIRSTCLIMQKTVTTPNGVRPEGKALQYGMAVKRELSGIKNSTRSIARKHFLEELKLRAIIAIKYLWVNPIIKGSVPKIVLQLGGANQALMIYQGFAPYAIRNTLEINTLYGIPALCHVEENMQNVKVIRIEPCGKADVYCLVADKTHAFSVEGGIIVHNCYDESSYRCRAKKLTSTSQEFLI